MRHLDRQDRRQLAVLATLLTVVILLIFRFRYLFGSETDWANQHWVIPQYFRKLFYETKQLFPSFAPNLGAGQNLFYLSYYGLFSPWVTVSLLLRFVPMKYCAIVAGVLSLYADLFLFYLWIRRRYSARVTFAVAFLFLFAGPLIFHTHRHLMFVTYMPFLLIALFGVDRYFRDGRRALIPLSALLIVTTSFYFAVGAYLAILLYAACRAASEGGPRVILRRTVTVGLLLVLSGLMAAALLLPTACALLSGRDSTSVSIGVIDFLPHIEVDLTLFGPYTLGIGFLSLLAILWQALTRRRGERLLAVSLLLLIGLPALPFLLNGMMYFDGKVLIPFLPLALLPTAELLTALASGKLNLRRTAFMAGILLAVSLLSLLPFWDRKENAIYLYLLTALECVLFVVLLLRCRSKPIAVLPTLVLVLAASLVINLSDTLVPRRAAADYASGAISELVAQTLAADDGDFRFGNLLNPRVTVNMVYSPGYYQTTIYSSAHNKRYTRLCYDLFRNEIPFRNSTMTVQSENYLFQCYMGQKYLLAPAGSRFPGYTAERELDGVAVLRNTSAFAPVRFGGTLMSRAEFDTLTWPGTVDALMRYTIVDRPAEPVYRNLTASEPFAPDLSSPLLTALDGGGYRVSAEKPFSVACPLPRTARNEILFLRFDVCNTVGRKSDDVSVTVNGTTNMLTKEGWKYHNHNDSFEYTLYADGAGTESLTVDFSRGDYTVRNFELFTAPAEALLAPPTGGTASLDRTFCHGDLLSGRVTAETDGFVCTTLPFDRGFSVTLDGEPVRAEELNGGFLGFAVGAGEHTATVRYTAPGLRVGKLISAVSSLAFLAVLLSDSLRYRRRMYKNAENIHSSESEMK